MKHIYIIFAAFSTLLLSCEEKKEDAFFVLDNAIDFARTEVVVISKNQLLEKLPKLNKSHILMFTDSQGTEVPYQLDDMDQDGEWDEVALVLDFSPNEEKKIIVSAFAKAGQNQTQFPKMTDVHFGVGIAKPNASEVQKYTRSYDPREKDLLFFQMEGPAWENDKVGFRMYFDPRNGIDIFGKTTAVPTLHKQGLSTDYHKKADWGMDILKVGNSLGAGSLAFKHQDSLYRLTGWNGARFETITEGPARAIFRMTYLDELIGEKSYNIVHTITIEKGDWFYKSDIEIHGITDGIELVTGIVDLKENNKSFYQTKEANQVLASFGKQSENEDHLGMALITMSGNNVSNTDAPLEGDGITRTHLLNLGCDKEHHFYFMSGWQASDALFKSELGFKQAIAATSAQITSPIIIK